MIFSIGTCARASACLTLHHQRQQTIDPKLAARGISNPLVLETMRRVPRERFVAQGLEEFAYEDSPSPIEAGQTILQSSIVAAMIEAAQVQLVCANRNRLGLRRRRPPHDRGPTLYNRAGSRTCRIGEKAFSRIGLRQIEARVGDDILGWRGAAPFDAIIGTAAGPRVPKPLRESSPSAADWCRENFGASAMRVGLLRSRGLRQNRKEARKRLIRSDFEADACPDSTRKTFK
jgi:hypothetical protein